MAEKVSVSGNGLLLIFLMIFSSCGQEKWKKTSGGLLFKVYSATGDDSIAKDGKIIKLNYIQLYGDSVIESRYEELPYYGKVVQGDSVYDLPAIYSGLKKGDSVVVRQRIDSMLKKKILLRVPWKMRDQDEWVTRIKVLGVFDSDSLAEHDKIKEEERIKSRQLTISRSRLVKLFKEKDISAAEIENGVFLRPMESGNGEKPETGDEVSVKMLIRTLRLGLKEESHESSGKEERFMMGGNELPAVIEQSILYTREGDRIKLYAPAVLVFGFDLSNKGMKLNDELEIDIRVVEVRK